MSQPWASMVALGHKKIETRSWRTHHTGLLVIHAARSFPKRGHPVWGLTSVIDAFKDTLEGQGSLPIGQAVAVCRVIGCVPTQLMVGQISEEERALGDYAPGRWAWVLEDIYALPEPVLMKGALGLFNVPEDAERKIAAQLIHRPLIRHVLHQTLDQYESERSMQAKPPDYVPERGETFSVAFGTAYTGRTCRCGFRTTDSESFDIHRGLRVIQCLPVRV